MSVVSIALKDSKCSFTDHGARFLNSWAFTTYSGVECTDLCINGQVDECPILRISSPESPASYRNVQITSRSDPDVVVDRNVVCVEEGSKNSKIVGHGIRLLL